MHTFSYFLKEIHVLCQFQVLKLVRLQKNSGNSQKKRRCVEIAKTKIILSSSYNLITLTINLHC